MVKLIYQRNYEALLKVFPNLEIWLKDFKNNPDSTPQSFKSKSEGYMDFSLEFLRDSKEGVRIAISHFYKKNGDLCPDPTMEIFIRTSETINMVFVHDYQDSFGYKCVYPAPNRVVPRFQKELNQFLAVWLRNLKSQKHKIDYISSNV